MSQELDSLQKQVEQNHDLEESAVTLIRGLADKIAAAGNDTAKLNALAASLRTSAADLAAAVAANTPADTAAEDEETTDGGEPQAG